MVQLADAFCGALLFVGVPWFGRIRLMKFEILQITIFIIITNALRPRQYGHHFPDLFIYASLDLNKFMQVR